MNITTQQARWKHHIILFLVAISIRSTLGYIFLGGIDALQSIKLSKEIFNGDIHAYLPYFPGLSPFFWLGGILLSKTFLPLTFCFKCMQILIDSVMACLIYDVVKKKNIHLAFHAGMLYAISPISIFVNSILGQWGSILLFFLLLAFYLQTFYKDSALKYVIFGFVFALSTLIKPLSLAFLLFFFVPRKKIIQELRHGARVIQGLAILFIIVGISFFVLFKTSNCSLQNVVSITQTHILPIILGIAIIVIPSIFFIMKNLKPRANFWKYIQHQLAALVSFKITLMLSLLIFAFLGYNIVTMLDTILRYLNQGVQLFGLPFTSIFKHPLLNVAIRNRIWIMGIIGFISYRYYTQKIDIFRALLISFAFILGFSGLSAQYLLWPIPFLLIVGWYKLAAAYNLICTSFCLLYYVHPMSNPAVPYQSTAAFAPLKTLSFLSPPHFLTHNFVPFFINALGNYLIPLISLAIAFYGIYTAHKLTIKNKNPSLQEKLIPLKNPYLLFTIGLGATLFALYLIFNTTIPAEQFQLLADTKLMLYDFQRIQGRLVANYAHASPINGVTLFFVLSIVWFVYALIISKKYEDNL